MAQANDMDGMIEYEDGSTFPEHPHPDEKFTVEMIDDMGNVCNETTIPFTRQGGIWAQELFDETVESNSHSDTPWMAIRLFQHCMEDGILVETILDEWELEEVEETLETLQMADEKLDLFMSDLQSWMDAGKEEKELPIC